MQNSSREGEREREREREEEIHMRQGPYWPLANAVTVDLAMNIKSAPSLNIAS